MIYLFWYCQTNCEDDYATDSYRFEGATKGDFRHYSFISERKVQKASRVHQFAVSGNALVRHAWFYPSK